MPHAIHHAVHHASHHVLQRPRSAPDHQRTTNAPRDAGEPSAEAKARGLVVEINNGRLAMIGIMGFLAESKVRSLPLHYYCITMLLHYYCMLLHYYCITTASRGAPRSAY